MDWAPPVHTAPERDHYATGPLSLRLDLLPDPDRVLRRAGKTVGALRDLLVDGHLSSVWDVRLTAVSAFATELVAGDDSPRARVALDFVRETTGDWRWSELVEQVAHADAYGYQPFERLWVADGRRWVVEALVSKPAEWFTVRDHRWMSWNNLVATELPPGRFSFATHKATYDNPYGIKLFSRVYWPVTIKRNGIAWWTKWLEKYGAAFLVGRHPIGAAPGDQEALLSALVKLTNSAVATVPDGSSVQVIESAHKGGSSTAHRVLVDCLNAEISKVLVGQSGPSELQQTGSYAAASVLNMVRQDIGAAVRRRVTAFVNQELRVLTTLNYGADYPAPKLRYLLPEDLQAERVERDAKLFRLGGVEPTMDYYVQQYGVDPAHIRPRDATAGPVPFDSEPVNPPAPGSGIRGVFERSRAARRGARADRRRQRAKRRLVAAWQTPERAAAQQAALDAIVDHYLSAIEDATDYDAAAHAVTAAAATSPVEGIAGAVIDARYVAAAVGGRYA